MSLHSETNRTWPPRAHRPLPCRAASCAPARPHRWCREGACCSPISRSTHGHPLAAESVATGRRQRASNRRPAPETDPSSASHRPEREPTPTGACCQKRTAETTAPISIPCTGREEPKTCRCEWLSARSAESCTRHRARVPQTAPARFPRRTRSTSRRAGQDGSRPG